MIQYRDSNLIVFESALYRTTSSVLLTDDVIVIVDPALLPGEVAHIREYVRRNTGNRQVLLFFSHSDFDHIAASGAFPEAKVIVSDLFEENLNKLDIVKEICRFDKEFYLDRDYEHSYPSGNILIRNSPEPMSFGDTSLVGYHAPGHTADSAFLIEDSKGILFAGDYLSNIEIPVVDHGIREYMATLQLAKSLIVEEGIRILVPGHGDVTTDIRDMMARIDMATDYLENILTSKEQGMTEIEEWQIKYPAIRATMELHRNNKKKPSNIKERRLHRGDNYKYSLIPKGI